MSTYRLTPKTNTNTRPKRQIEGSEFFGHCGWHCEMIRLTNLRDWVLGNAFNIQSWMIIPDLKYPLVASIDVLFGPIFALHPYNRTRVQINCMDWFSLLNFMVWASVFQTCLASVTRKGNTDNIPSQSMAQQIENNLFLTTKKLFRISETFSVKHSMKICNIRCLSFKKHPVNIHENYTI